MHAGYQSFYEKVSTNKFNKFSQFVFKLSSQDDAKCGALRRIPMRTPPRVPAIGIVMIQENNRSPTRWKLMALRVPLQRPTPTVAPVMHIEVETGREY
jgi:hypothetical protein